MSRPARGENNKAWDAATEVRTVWLTKYLTRTTPPISAALMLAQAFIDHDGGIDQSFGYEGIGNLVLGHEHTPDFSKANA